MATRQCVRERLWRSRPNHFVKPPNEGVSEAMGDAVFDVYVKIDDRSLRIATRKGTGLPSHVIASEWVLMPSGASQVIDDAEDDIEARGFCFYRLRE
jgi:hypothetical protein